MNGTSSFFNCKYNFEEKKKERKKNTKEIDRAAHCTPQYVDKSHAIIQNNVYLSNAQVD